MKVTARPERAGLVARLDKLSSVQEPALLTPDEIRQAFLTEVASSPGGAMSYADLWDRLRARGKSVRGSTPKRQRDAVYRALLTDSRITKVGPGLFAAQR